MTWAVPYQCSALSIAVNATTAQVMCIAVIVMSSYRSPQFKYMI